MRELNYAVEGKVLNNRAFAMDKPGPGGACHEYRIKDADCTRALGFVTFQNGPVKESGANGVQHEDLIAIVIDRLEGFQAGAYACEENGVALDHLRLALNVLQNRTRKRMARGVEGTSTV